MRCLMKLQPRAQFIVATHSPDIYDEAPSVSAIFGTEDNPRARIWRPVKPIGAGACPIMSLDVARAGLYRGSINLWVEDALTRETCRSLEMMQASGSWWAAETRESAIVKDAKDAGFGNVFAVTDRDFRDSNQSEWDNPARSFRTFILPVHEIENYLLDPAALHASRFSNTVFECPGLTASWRLPRFASAGGQRAVKSWLN